MRMALVEGLHRALPVEQLGEKRVERCTKIWWTVYILDRKFSSLIGSPTSVNDEDVTTILWDLKTCSQEAAALSLHVKITQVITRVLNTVYSANGKLGNAFLQGIRSILHEMSDLSRELEEVFAHRFSSSVDTLSGVTTRLTLSCHSVRVVPFVMRRWLIEAVHHRHRSSTHPKFALGATKLLRRGRRLPKSICPHPNPDPSVHRFSTPIIEDTNGSARPESP